MASRTRFEHRLTLGRRPWRVPWIFEVYHADDPPDGASPDRVVSDPAVATPGGGTGHGRGGAGTPAGAARDGWHGTDGPLSPPDAA